MATSSIFNRGYSGGLAAGRRPGGGFGPSFASSFQPAPASPTGGRFVPGNNGSQVWLKDESISPQVSPQVSPPFVPKNSFGFGPPQPKARIAPPGGDAPWDLPQSMQGKQPWEMPFGGAFAAGGIAPPNAASLVGEEGPELIVPRVPVQVIPAPQTRQMLDAGPLSMRPATPVGRGGMTPERRMQMFARRMWTRGDEAGAAQMQGHLAQLAQQREMQRSGQDFSREMNAANFQQGLLMNSRQQQAQAARDAQMRRDRMDDWTRGEQSQTRRDEAQRNWELTRIGLEQGQRAMEAERERREREAERSRVPRVGTIPVPGTDYVMPTADGRVLGTVPTTRREAPLPPGFAPRSAQRDGILYAPQQDSQAAYEMPKIYQGDRSSMDPKQRRDYYYQPHPQTGRPVKVFIDEDGDQGSLSTRPAQPTRQPSKFVEF